MSVAWPVLVSQKHELDARGAGPEHLFDLLFVELVGTSHIPLHVVGESPDG